MAPSTFLVHVTMVYPCMQQGCHGYTQTHPPSQERGDAERFRGAGAEAFPPLTPNPQSPFSVPLPPKRILVPYSL